MKTIYFKRLILFSIYFFLSAAFLQAQQIAFPGAEGAGAFTSGGRGTTLVPTTVFEVTSLSDDGLAGTLRYAVTNNSPVALYRTIVFKVSGTIHLSSALSINRANTTIAGQTAPGDGICIADYPVSISNDNVIVRYIRFRMGDKNQLKTSPAGCGVPVAPFTASCTPVDGSGGDDAFGALGRKNLIIDHCTMSWSSDEACTVYRGDSTTLQWNLISEPLNYSYHFETGDADFEHHGYGGIWGGRHASFHHNLLAHIQGRVPRFDGSRNLPNSTSPVEGSENADFRNNVLYDWGGYNVNAGEGGNYNVVNNYYKWGPSTSTGTSSGVSIRYMVLNPYKQTSPALPYGKFYLAGNYVDSLQGIPSVNTYNNWRGVAMSGGSIADTTLSKVDVPFAIAPPVSTQTALEAYDLVLQNAGASLPRRDTLDQRIVNDVKNRTGRIIDVQGGYPHATPYAQTVNAWPTLNSLPAPADTDHDGMPDNWETANGLNPGDPADRQNVAANGYTNLENYLNSITNNNTTAQAYFSGTLTGFSQYSDAPSAVQTITVSGVNLTGNITVTPPAAYEVSADNGTTWNTNANPLTLTPAGGGLATTLSVRLNAPVIGTYNGNITGSSPGVDNFSIAVTGSRTNAPVANPVSATWTLLSNQSPTVSASAITATNQALGSLLAGTSYNSTFGGTSGWQRVANTTPGLPVGYDQNAYVEYTVTPVSGKILNVSSISIEALGGGTGTARMAAYYSLNNFATSAPVGSATYNNGLPYAATTADPVVLLNTSTTSLTGQQIATLSTNITVQPLQTLSVRLYVWAGSTGRYFTSKNVIINGTTTDVVLPLKLIGFSTAKDNGNARLLWNTQNERNVKGFEIERSADGQNFVTTGFVNAGNSINGNSYAFTDANPYKGQNYYRIKMIDEDGNYSYSKVLTVDFTLGNLLTVYPNPAAGVLTVTYPQDAAGNYIRVSSIAGKLLKSIKVKEGSSQMQVDVSSLPNGVYMISVSDGKVEKSTRFIKQ